MCSNFKAENENITVNGVAPPSQRRRGLGIYEVLKARTDKLIFGWIQHIKISTNVSTLVGFLCK